MVKPQTLLWLLAASALVGCETAKEPSGAVPLSPDAALAQAIERQVTAQAPEYDLRQYTRLYTRGAGGNVEATYIALPTGGVPEKWKRGESYWVAPRDVPRVLDGGCSIINVLYHAPTKTLVSLNCNGDA